MKILALIIFIAIVGVFFYMIAQLIKDFNEKPVSETDDKDSI
ncbi:hypothetical protein [Mucilaginibacter sp. SP1R1]|nr:hypothetical protein [Mucilaginibacter sp. SP1R1]MBB6149478.1 uncharacterized protein YpmB [Mucilaginibacter sp. SP1R1]